MLPHDESITPRVIWVSSFAFYLRLSPSFIYSSSQSIGTIAPISLSGSIFFSIACVPPSIRVF